MTPAWRLPVSGIATAEPRRTGARSCTDSNGAAGRPSFAYRLASSAVSPTFGWSSSVNSATTQFDSVRRGRGLRVYLDRPWFSSGDGERLGLWGFGSAAHIIAQVARWQDRRVFAFTRPGDEAAQALAREVGAEWAGGSDEQPPEPLDAAIIIAPVGALVPVALGAVARGGTVVCGGIHMSDIPSFGY